MARPRTTRIFAGSFGSMASVTSLTAVDCEIP